MEAGYLVSEEPMDPGIAHNRPRETQRPSRHINPCSFVRHALNGRSVVLAKANAASTLSEGVMAALARSAAIFSAYRCCLDNRWRFRPVRIIAQN